MINGKTKKMYLKFIELYNIIIFVIIILNEIKITKEYNLVLLNLKNEITIRINGTGTQKILSDYYENNIPSEIIVNNIHIEDNTYKYIDNLVDEINNITMIWNEPLFNSSSMFKRLKNIISIDLSNFDSSKVLSMKNMFADCSSLKSLGLSKLDTSSVTDMSYMFSDCSLLQSLDLSNLNTSLVKDMSKMFSGSKSLISLDLSKLDISSVTNMRGMFTDCISLKFLNLSNLNSSLVKEMKYMLSGCNLLQYLDISNLNTSSVKDMQYMFLSCSSLISIDLSKLDTSSVTDMEGMFAGCSLLQSLDLSNLNTSSVKNMQYMFSSCSSLISIDLSKLDTSSVTDMKEMFSDCSSLISLDLSNFVDNINLTYNDMFLNCNQSLLCCINNKTKMSNKFLSFINEKIKNNNCSDVCFSENKKVILEKKICILNCSDDDINKYEYNKRCYENCPNGTYISSINNHICIEYYDDINLFYHLFENNEISIDNILDNLRYELRNKKLNAIIDNIIIKDKNILIYKNNNIIYELSSTYINNNDNNNNKSSINLRECENKLKINNDININDTLLILKVDIYGIGILIPVIEYEIYNIKTKEKLNLTICKNDKIDISIPVNLNENKLYEYNISDEYYNDICCVKDSDLDIILNDRRNEYYTNNMFVCEKDCIFKEYNYNTKEVVCECLVKIKFPLISEIYVDKNLFINDIKNISNIINLEIIKCYDLLFSKEGIIKNIGNYILISIILNNMVLLLVFIIKGFKEIENQIEYIKIKNNNKNIHKNKHKNIHKNKKFEKKIKEKKKQKNIKSIEKKQIILQKIKKNKVLKILVILKK